MKELLGIKYTLKGICLIMGLSALTHIVARYIIQSILANGLIPFPVDVESLTYIGIFFVTGVIGGIFLGE